MKIDDMQRLAKLKFSYTEEDHRKMFAYLQQIGIDPKKLYQELEMSSRYVNTHRDTSYSNATVSLHSHNYIEILCCRTSSDVEYLIGSERYKLQKGDIVFIPPGVSHRPIMPERLTVPYERDVLWISQEFVQMITGISPEHAVSLPESSVPIRTGGTRWEFLCELFRTGVIEEEKKHPGWELAVIGNTLTILAHMKRAYMERSTGAMKAERPELLDKVTAYIEEHYAGHITVHDIARKFYVSDSSISHQFKQKMGISIYHYVTQRRLISAKNLISEGVQMEQVAVRVGFSDYSAFYRAFKQEYGISPRQYRSIQEGNK